jgi:serine/threonine-protein kinase
MAPEVIAGERSLDARADVYALGVTVFESIAGQPPFRARHPGRLLTEIMNGDRPPLTAFATRAEGDTEAKANRAAIDQVLATAMHRRPAQRFESVRAFASALGALRAAQVSGAEDESGGDVPRAR